MKRGVLLNLKILFVLIVLAGLPLLIMPVAAQTADILGCEISGITMPDGFCGTLYAILMIVGWSSIAILPFTVGGLLLYLLGVLLFFSGSLLMAGLKRQPVSPTIKGMGISALACSFLAGCLGSGTVTAIWYQTEYASRCRGLPQITTVGRQNGPLALGIEVLATTPVESLTILAVTPDGQPLFQLDKSYRGRAPAWSPDGRWIVFVSNRGKNLWQNGAYNLYIMAADGRNQCQLTEGQDGVWRAVWSPDGEWIAYVAWLSDEVQLIRPKGQESRRLSLPIEVKSIYSLDWAAAQ